MSTWADAVLTALDGVGVKDFALCGISMGGYLAFALLRRAPERIRALALLSTRATPDTDAARADRLAMAARMRTGGTTAVAELVEPMTARLLSPAAAGEFHISDPVRGRIRRCSPAGIAACQEAMAGRGDSTDLLAGIQVPVLVVSGGEDGITSPDEMRGMAAAIPGARFELLAGAGHLVNLERPPRVTALLREFLDSA